MADFLQFSTEYTADPPCVGVSRCLLGESVRYDGGHKQCLIVTADLAAYLRFLPLCPEMDAALGVPRPPIELFVSNKALRLRRVEDGLDLTDSLRHILPAYRHRIQSLHGLILKARSPSCGITDTPLHNADGSLRELGAGFVLRQLDVPAGFPVIDEQTLQLAGGAEDFLRRVRAYRDACQ